MATTEVARSRGAGKTMGDMARSLGLMAVVIAALLLLGPARSLLFPGADRMPAVDYGYSAHKFGQVAGTPALVPAATPHGWRATSARLTEPRPHGVRLHVGWAVPGSRYAGLDEAVGVPALVRNVLGAAGARVLGDVDLAGASWQRRVSSRGESALTRTVGSLTLVVTGNASQAQLEQLATSLR